MNELKIYVHFFNKICMKIQIMKILIFSYKNSSVDFIDVLAVFTVTPERGINFTFSISLSLEIHMSMFSQAGFTIDLMQYFQ